MTIKREYLKITTATDGSATVNGSRTIRGLIYAVKWIDGNFGDGVSFVLTTDGSEADMPILSVANANADEVYYPREIPHAVADGAALTATAGGDRVLPVVDGILKIVVSSGGDAKTGGVIVYFEE